MRPLTRFFSLAVFALSLALASSSTANITLAPLTTGLTYPVDIANAGDGSKRLFVVEQGGRIRVIQNGILLATPFLDLTTAPSIVSTGGERGLLGLAFHPQYASNGQFFVYFTSNTNLGVALGDIVIARYQRMTNDANRADPASRTTILTIPHSTYDNHNGGSLRFGPDGYLYAGVGDGGSGGDPDNNGQNLNVLLGKLLRINVNSGSPYSIPAGNPFAGGGGRPEIWAYGLRNPWRFSFDRGTGDLYIGDVGQNAWEEIDRQAAGAAGGMNYGWRIREGNHCYNPSSGCVNPPNYVAPMLEYSHGEGFAVTGGYVYRGQSTPDLAGRYVFADYGNGSLWYTPATLPSSTYTLISGLTAQVSSFGESESGELYLTNYTGGGIYSFSSSTDITPDAVQFFPQTGVARSTQIASNIVKITGLGAGANLSITNGEYTLAAANATTCSSSYTTAATVIQADTVICVRHTSAATYSASNTTTLTIGATPITFTTTTLAAPPSYTVTPTVGANGFLSPLGPQTVFQGNTAQFTITPATGYTAVVGGTCGGMLNGVNYTTNPVTANCTVDAQFTRISYAVTSSAGGNGAIAPGGLQNVLYGDTASFTVTPNAGYTASVDGTCGGTLTGNTFVTAPVSAACTVVASFALNLYTVTPSAGANGAISPAFAQSVAHGSIAIFTVTPNPGYAASVGGTCGGTLAGTTYTTSGITGNCTVVAGFTFIPVAPGAPVIGSAVAGDTQVSINFSAPASDGGAAISSYTATCLPSGANVSGASSPLTVSGLPNDQLQSCSVSATNGVGTGPASVPVDVTPTSGATLQLLAVKSRKLHAGVARTLDIDHLAAISGPLTVEPRMPGAGHTIVFEFNLAISAPGTVVVTDAADVPIGSASVSKSGNDVIVTLADIPDIQRIKLTLSGVNGTGFSKTVALAFMVGDVNNSQTVNASDISAVKAHVGKPLDNVNFVFDFNASGAIDAADVSAAKARSGRIVP